MNKRALPSLVATALLAACAAGTGSPSASSQAQSPSEPAPTATVSASTPAGGTVGVTLQEFSIVLDTDTVKAGSVTFHVSNTGPSEVHEFVLIRTDLAPDKLPTGTDGAVEEEAEGLTVLGEVEDLAVGKSKDLTLDVSPGAYVAICNINDNDQVHYMLGMRVGFTAE